MASTTAIYTGGGPTELQSLNTAWAKTTAVYYPKLFPLLAKAQNPQIMWIGCSDSRVPETELLGLLPGEVFVHRNIANAFNGDDFSLPAALDYAVDHVKVQHIIVCGHTGCGGIAGTCSTALVGIPTVDRWLAPLRALLNSRHSKLGALSSDNQQTAMIKINLANSVTKISASALVADAISKGSLQVHGAIYDTATGKLNFLSDTDLAVTATDPCYGRDFQQGWWYTITNPVLGTQTYVDIQHGALQCNGSGGQYGNQHWKWTVQLDGSFTMSSAGDQSNCVATVDMMTFFVSTQPPSKGDTSVQHFRPSMTYTGEWLFTCDALPSCYLLNFDPATSTLKMSSAAGPGSMWHLNQLNKV